MEAIPLPVESPAMIADGDGDGGEVVDAPLTHNGVVTRPHADDIDAPAFT